jgi:hypothetical protein
VHGAACDPARPADCVAGEQCVVHDGGAPTCRTLCAKDGDACGDGESCRPSLGGISGYCVPD